MRNEYLVDLLYHSIRGDKIRPDDLYRIVQRNTIACKAHTVHRCPYIQNTIPPVSKTVSSMIQLKLSFEVAGKIKPIQYVRDQDGRYIIATAGEIAVYQLQAIVIHRYGVGISISNKSGIRRYQQGIAEDRYLIIVALPRIRRIGIGIRHQQPKRINMTHQRGKEFHVPALVQYIQLAACGRKSHATDHLQHSIPQLDIAMCHHDPVDKNAIITLGDKGLVGRVQGTELLL